MPFGATPINVIVSLASIVISALPELYVVSPTATAWAAASDVANAVVSAADKE